MIALRLPRAASDDEVLSDGGHAFAGSHQGASPPQTRAAHRRHHRAAAGVQECVGARVCLARAAARGHAPFGGGGGPPPGNMAPVVFFTGSALSN